MLLCDDILFWHQHLQQPRFESEFEMYWYEIECGFRSFQEGIRKMIAAAPAFSRAMNQLAEAMRTITNQ
jgi:hypothetical protein